MTVEVVVASGKGGTGKTFVSSNLAVYLVGKGVEVVAVDADVEAPDLLLALGGPTRLLWKEVFYGSQVPVIDFSKCVKCWSCISACRFNAISRGGEGPVIDYDACEGLGVCALVCPTGALTLKPRRTGEIRVSETSYGVKVITGELDLGGRNSGRLVYELKRRGRALGGDVVVVDAAPGIGCPVISSISGADLLVIVVEPTPQSLRGAKRLVRVAETLNTEWLALVNKYDINRGYSAKVVEAFNGRVVGVLPYDEIAVEAYTSMTPLLMYSPDSPLSKSLREVLSAISNKVGV